MGMSGGLDIVIPDILDVNAALTCRLRCYQALAGGKADAPNHHVDRAREVGLSAP